MKAYIILFILLLSTSKVFSNVTLKEPLLDNDGNVFGFNTVDPDLYFLIPGDWKNNSTNTFIRKEQGLYYFYFVANPNYTKALNSFSDKVEFRPGQVLLPLPYNVTNTELYLFSDVGNLVFSVTQDSNNLSSGDSIYFKIEMTQSQYDTFMQLANGGLALTGNLTYQYEGEFGASQSAVPITVQVDQNLSNTAPEQYELAWINNIMQTTNLYIENAADGHYSLGIFGVDIDNSLLNCDPLNDRYKLERRADVISMIPTTNKGNLYCSISFDIRQLSFSKTFNIKLNVEVDLDLSRLSVEIVHLNPISDSEENDPYYAIVGKILTKQSSRDKISKEITKRLRERIFNQNLIFLIRNP